MFSGIVETKSPILKVVPDRELIKIAVARPSSFDDIKVGDSVCSNGVCLTVESYDSETMTFSLGAETLKVTGWTPETLISKEMNLERSLRMSDRVHGHIVTGHVDAGGEVVAVKDLGGSVQIDIRAPRELHPYLWKKGSWAVNGVSLTINEVNTDVISVCLIPETLQRTNLSALRVGSRVNLEVDWGARAAVHFLSTQGLTFPDGSRTLPQKDGE